MTTRIEPAVPPYAPEVAADFAALIAANEDLKHDLLELLNG